MTDRTRLSVADRTGWNKEDLDRCADSIKSSTDRDLHPGNMCPEEYANLISSMCTDGKTHMPVLDIDFPAKLIPSTTEEHYHLYLDKELSWEAYLEVLEVLAKHGIIQQGFLLAAKHRGMTMVRKPGVKKNAST